VERPELPQGNIHVYDARNHAFFAVRLELPKMGKLTTHVLDISTGVPASGLRIEVQEWPSSAASRPVVSAVTGPDGRLSAPLLAGETFRAGRYSLTFHIASYFRGRGVVLPEPAFIEEAVIRIGIADPEQHYHVPLLIAPWSYSVYRGG
jgi:hydroxyisourate hydrolase